MKNGEREGQEEREKKNQAKIERGLSECEGKWGGWSVQKQRNDAVGKAAMSLKGNLECSASLSNPDRSNMSHKASFA